VAGAGFVLELSENPFEYGSCAFLERIGASDCVND
jgi:hypothetical protein